MPSRKKAKGKARKAAKEAKAKEEESRAVGVVAASQQHVPEERLKAMMQRLRISAPSPTLCRHGCPHLSAGEEKICLEFIDAFNIAAVNSHDDAGQDFVAATEATMDKYAVVYDTMLDTTISMLLASGTQSILDERNDIAQRYASLAFSFEGLMACAKRQDFNLSKAIELENADDHTLVSYYRKRIPCACLDEKYKEVKSVKKMGLCWNESCSLSERMVERSKMFSCTRCGEANYCSVECQKAAWKIHKPLCGTTAEVKAVINSSS